VPPGSGGAASAAAIPVVSWVRERVGTVARAAFARAAAALRCAFVIFGIGCCRAPVPPSDCARRSGPPARVNAATMMAKSHMMRPETVFNLYIDLPS